MNLKRTEPALSVVLAASSGMSSLQECLASLTGQGEEADTEVVVVSNYGEKSKAAVESAFPFAKLVVLPEDTPVPELRSLGIARSRGKVVALIEDHCIVPADWCSRIKEVHQAPHPVVGGSIENASGNSLLDWAVYFYEYGRYMPPNASGETDSLSGINVSYKRWVLEKVGPSDGFHETFVHRNVQRQGIPLFLAPSLMVYQRQSHTIGQAVARCFHHGRSFAAIRVAASSLFGRMALTIGSLILPILLPSRIAAQVFQKGRHTREMALCFPYLLLLMASWSFGEFCGYAFGAGSSAGV